MIKMISGVYGMPIKHPDGRTTVKGVGAKDGPFSLTPEQEKRLVDRKVAVYVVQPDIVEDDTEQQEQVEVDTDPIGFDETPPTDEVEEEPIDLETLTGKELREMGEAYGLTFKANAKKADMIKAITEAQANLADDVDAPIFDASEAVL